MAPKHQNTAKKVALYGMLTALAFVLSYVENLFPIYLGAPGIKLGLANLASIVALYTMGLPAAAAISLTRIVLAGFTFSNLSMMIYSLAGGAVSLLVMSLLKKLPGFGIMGVSAAGGVSHNLAQLAVACMILETSALAAYLPVLLFAGTAAGCGIGLLGGLVTERVKRLKMSIK